MFKSIRYQLIFMVSILVILALGVSMSCSFYLTSADFEKHIKQTNTVMAESLASNIRQFMENAYNINTELAGNPDIIGFEPLKQKEVLLDSVVQYPFFQLFITHKLDGDQTARSSGPLTNRGDRWWFKKFMAEKKPYIGKSYYSVFSNTAVTTMVHGIYNDDELIGVVMANIETATLQPMVEKYNSGPGSYAYLLDGDGMVVVHPDKRQIAELYNYKTQKKVMLKRDDRGRVIRDEKGNELTEEVDLKIPDKLTEIIDKVLQGETGIGEYTDFDGNDYVCAYRSIPLPGGSDPWNLIMVQKKSTALAFLTDVAIKNSMIGLLVLVISIVLTYWFANRITRPLIAIVDATQLIAAGDLSVIIKRRGTQDEIGLLENSIGRMVGKLQEMVEELENKNSLLATEITERKQAKAALVRANDDLEIKVEIRTHELMAMNEELQVMNETVSYALQELKQTQEQLIQSGKMASLGGLVAGVAHEVNTPVGVSVTAASYLAGLSQKISKMYHAGALTREDLEGYLIETEQSMTILTANLERAAHLINSFKKVSVDQSSENKRLFMVTEYLGEIILTLHPKFKNTQIEIIVEGDKQLELYGHAGAFAQIITNLLDNSLVHAYEKKEKAGCIRITFYAVDRNFHLVYTDDGKGMSHDTIAHIFDPFFTTNRGQGGTGLGMHIVYNIVTQNFKGRIKCSSIEGEGATFSISFPMG